MFNKTKDNTIQRSVPRANQPANKFLLSFISFRTIKIFWNRLKVFLCWGLLVEECQLPIIISYFFFVNTVAPIYKCNW